MPGSISPVMGETGHPVAEELSESIRTRYSVVAALAITQVKRTKHGARARMKRVIVLASQLLGTGVPQRRMIHPFSGIGEKKKVLLGLRMAIYQYRNAGVVRFPTATTRRSDGIPEIMS